LTAETRALKAKEEEKTIYRRGAEERRSEEEETEEAFEGDYMDSLITWIKKKEMKHIC
jgi:hypothetical protein